VKTIVVGTPALIAAGVVDNSSAYSRVSKGSPGTSAIPHFLHRPAASAVTSGCIGQNHAVNSAGGDAVCCAAPSETTATSSNASLVMCIVVQRNRKRRHS